MYYYLHPKIFKWYLYGIQQKDLQCSCLKKIDLTWEARGLRLSELRKYTGILWNPKQLMQEEKF